MKRNSILAVAAIGLALVAPALAKDKTIMWTPGTTIDFMTTVNGVREVPVGMPMPGIHLDVVVDGHALDVYLAPTDFCTKFDIKVAKGESVMLVGTLKAPAMGERDVMLAREISTGVFRGGFFKPTLTVYLRNDDGPFWIEPTPVPATAVVGPFE